MNTTPEHLDDLLRSAPVPRPPAALKEKILARVAAGCPPKSASREVGARKTVSTLTRGSSWRRCWPLLLPAGVAAAVASVLLVRQNQLQEERRSVREMAMVESSSNDEPANAAREVAVAVPDERSEIARLAQLVSALAKDAEGLARLQEENQRLGAMLATAMASLPKEYQQLAEVSDRASSIRCVNNLKQIGLAVRVFATDNEDDFPPNFLVISNELVTPKILVCPSDTGRVVAESWSAYSPANTTYEFLSPGPGKFEHEPTRVLTRCPIHGNVGLCDGSVQMGVEKTRPQDFVSRNGASYYEPPAHADARQSVQPSGDSGTAPAGNASASVPNARRVKMATEEPNGGVTVGEAGSGTGLGSFSRQAVVTVREVATNVVRFSRTRLDGEGPSGVFLMRVEDPRSGQILSENVVDGGDFVLEGPDGEIQMEVVYDEEVSVPPTTNEEPKP